MRTVRQNTAGAAYHLIWRFVDREWLFNDDEERATYLRFLGAALAQSDWSCFSYALMSNHIHIGSIAGHEPMASWTRAVNSPFAHWMNRRHRRLGPIFADRSKDYEVAPAKIGDLIAYIHNNPVRAAVVRRAHESTWTSHRAYLGQVSHAWLDVEDGLSRAGFSDPLEFDAWVDRTPGDPGIAEIERVRTVRRLARQRGAIEVGTPAIENGQRVVPLVARPHAIIRHDPREVAAVVAAELDIPDRLLCSRRRNATVVAARAVVVHAGRAAGLTCSELATALGVTVQTVSRIDRQPLRRELEPALAAVCARLMITVQRSGLAKTGS